jgi:hypothetical protein
MNITDYKKKYLKYKAKYLNIKGGASQSKAKMDIGKAKAALRNINFLITAFLPKNTAGEFKMTKHANDKIVTSHTFGYYMREYLLYEVETSGTKISDSKTNIENYETLVNGLKRFGVSGLKNYNECIVDECLKRSTSTLSDAKNYMNKLMYINAIYILSILNYDYIYNLYNWLIKYGQEKNKKNYTSYCTLYFKFYICT